MLRKFFVLLIVGYTPRTNLFGAFTFCLRTFFILFCTQICYANYPLLDVDTNMRIVLVPHDAPVGCIIYRLRASDSDHNFPLKFEVLGVIGQTLLELQYLGCSKLESLCQADVILKKALDVGRTYEFQIRVTDTTGDFTRVKAVITSTHGYVSEQNMLGGKILRIPENTPVGKMLETFVVSKNQLNTRPVLLEIRELEGRVELKQKLLSNNRTEGILYLKKELDFEKEPWFTFQLLALNGHTNSSVDTRNVLVSEIAVLIEDIQDTPPKFTKIMPSIELSNKLRPGDLITQVKAEDGDKENKRLIRYGLLSDSNPFVTFFDLNSMTGEIRLRRNITELFMMTIPNEPVQITVMAEEIVPDNAKLARLSDGKSTTVTNLTFWYGRDVALGPPIFSFDKFFGEIEENSPVGTAVKFSTATTVWVSNSDANIELDFSNHNQNYVFSVSPKSGRGNISFAILVTDSSLLDFERTQLFKLNLKASTSSGLSNIVPIEISVRDVNDNTPIFSQHEYVVEINEMAPYGTKVAQINATDRDSGLFGQVIYSNLVGSDAFRIDPDGTIFVENSLELDRETQPEIRLYVEAKDGGLTESNEPNFVRNVATGTIIVKLRDVNEPPVCESKLYQVILTPDLDGLKWPVYIKAIDKDAVGPNSELRYQILGDTRFSVDSISGQIHLKYPIKFSSRDLGNLYLGSFKVRAFDLGFPQMSTECVVQIYSEDVVSQEIGFVFPSSADAISRERERVERMLSQFTGGHASIINISPFDSTKSSLPPTQMIEKRLLSPESRLAALNDERKQPQRSEPESSASDQSVVLVSVQSPLSSRTRFVDLGSLKDFMVTEPTTSPGAQTGVTAGESRTLFWLLIALIILLLLLFLLFLCCLFCPCCYLFRNGKRSEKIEKHTERFVETREPPARRSRKTYPVQVVDSADEVDYNVNYRTREAWSGNRQWRGRQAQRGGGGRQRNAQNEPANIRGGEDVVVEDWEFAEYQQEQSPAEDLGSRWQMQQQSHRRYPSEQQRRRVAYVGQTHPGDEDFVRQQERASGPISYIEVKESEGLSRHHRQRSPTQSLPPATSSDYRIDSTKELQTRFYKTNEAEVLQLEYDDEDGDEGKEMLMRRFINEQHPQGDGSSPPLEESATSRGTRSVRRRQLTPAGQKVPVGGIVEGFDEDEEPDQEFAIGRPKAASVLRRQNGALEVQGPFGREINKIDEEDEFQMTVPIVAVQRESQQDEEKKKSKSHHKRHKDKEKDTTDKTKSKHRSRSKEAKTTDEEQRQKSKTEVKSRSPPSRSRSPSPPVFKTKPKYDEKIKPLTDSSRQASRTGSSLGLPEIEIPAIQEENMLTEESQQPLQTIAIEVISPSTAKSSVKDEHTPSHSIEKQQEIVDAAPEEDEDSGIGLIANKKSKMLEKKSVFDIAYDEMVTQNVLRPDTALNQQEFDFSENT